MDQQPERGQFTHDARDRFTHDQIGKGHVGVESVDPDTQEKTGTMIHDSPTDTIAAQDHQNKHTGHELRAAKESGNHPSSDSQGGGHHVERVVTNTGSYMMEKDTGESGTTTQGTDMMQQQSGDMEQQQSGNEQTSQMSGEELRGRIDQMMEESGGHFSRGTWVGNKQEQHLVHHLKNAHELGHGHHGPGEGNIPKHVDKGPLLGHTTKAEQHLGKSEREAQLALDMADAERSHRKEHQSKQMEHQLEEHEQRMKQQQDIANSHIIDTTNFRKGETM